MLPIHWWKSIGPSVVWAVKLGASSPMRSDMGCLLGERRMLPPDAPATHPVFFGRSRDRRGGRRFRAANLYYYFDSKDELLLVLPGPHARAHARRGGRGAGAAAQPSAAQLGAMIERPPARACSTSSRARPRTSKLDSLPARAAREDRSSKRDKYERALRALVDAGRARAANSRPCDAALVTRAMLGAVNWTARWFRRRWRAERRATSALTYLRLPGERALR